jgi:predicted glycogen debranching enzyme
MKTKNVNGLTLDFSGPFDLDVAMEREWLLTNGIGGYSSSSFCGMNTRRYHGLLVAALKPPAQRTLLVAKMEEKITTGASTYLLSTNMYPGVIHPDGYKLLQDIEITPDSVTTKFIAGMARMEKEIRMVPGENSTLIEYRNTGPQPFTLMITPLVNARDFHGETRDGSIPFSIDVPRWEGGAIVHVKPSWMHEGFWMRSSVGSWDADPDWYRNIRHIWEERRGLSSTDNHFAPGHFVVELRPGHTLSITLSTEEKRLPAKLAALPIVEIDEPVEIAFLRRTAETFLVDRTIDGQEKPGKTVIAGYHWFGDWGRDTMIALPGLCINSKKYDIAADILRTFAASLRRGLLPNLFLDGGDGEAYNTVDASLWFVNAVYALYNATHDNALLEELRRPLEEIIYCYRFGTDYGIRMDKDALIIADAPGWQLTWMDAKVGDWVVTPRAGKPVEINALWYNALTIMEKFSSDLGWGGDYGKLADRVKRNFVKFWYEPGEYLYDVLGEKSDISLRPNQIFAVSLPYSPLPSAQAFSVVKTVERFLLTPYGLRTLPRHDPSYHGLYVGGPLERDGGYHQGTIWAWLIGPYVDAYLKVHGYTKTAKKHCREILKPLLKHVWDAGVGSVSEIFDAELPHYPKGTISQAWSVSELIRAWDSCGE